VKLLNIDANPKTVKGQAHGYMTAILYLSPYKISGKNLCPMAEAAGCWRTCLNVQGRARIARSDMEVNGYYLPDNAIQRARLARTRLFLDRPAEFMQQLIRELDAFVKRAKRKGLMPCVRLNGTSDIVWERRSCSGEHREALPAYTIFDRFPGVQFYDYTKLPVRLHRKLPANYHLTVSYSAADKAYAAQCWAAHKAGRNVVMVVRSKGERDRLVSHGCVDGDAHDLRFLDPPGSWIVLAAKGTAKHDHGGFVLDGVTRTELGL
jgi:hypothetical protein